MSDAKKLSDLAATWLPAPKLNPSERRGNYYTDILIVSAPGDFMSRPLEGIADWANLELTCLMRTTTPSGHVTLHGPFPIPLTTLQNWGVLPKPDDPAPDGIPTPVTPKPPNDKGLEAAQRLKRKSQIERLRAENAQLRDKWIRAVADLEKCKQETR